MVAGCGNERVLAQIKGEKKVRVPPAISERKPAGSMMQNVFEKQIARGDFAEIEVAILEII